MQTKHSVIRQIITADFGCDECAENAKCPIYRGERSSISLPRMPALPRLAYTYERAMLLLIDRMGQMTPTQALSLIGHKTYPQPRSAKFTNFRSLPTISCRHPFPPCAAELTGPECPTPREVANLILRRTRIWQREHPGCDWHEIVTPNWHDYVARNIK